MISNRVIQEMIESELNYQNSLSKIVTASNEPFYAEGPELFQRLATAVNKFAELSESLHLNASIELTQNLSNSELSELRAQRMALIGEFFTEFKNYMSLYEEFLKTKYAANTSSNKLSFKQLDNFLKPTLSNSDSLLIQPLQRGPRYELLIRDALKRDDELSEGAPDKLTPAARAQLEVLLATTKTYLVEANKRQETPGYRFGDVTRELIRRGSEILTSRSSPVLSSMPGISAAEETTKPSGYTFGDYTRSFANRFWSKAPVEIGTPVLVSSTYSSLPSTQIPSAEPAIKQTPPDLPPRDLSPVNTSSSGTSSSDNDSDIERTFTFY